ncbi:hypothetical protein [Pseudofrankia sp. DC12]|uniref:hypothetical protein n=1 Tax=Pseudofrankia sp. DC12 TaxID=683315 RepID=UPI0005F87F2F|nr:hypothetical protein [Pseudofrankia sp. DC12]
MAELIDESTLPTGFSYPREFIAILNIGMTDLTPWWIPTGEMLQDRYSGLRERFTGRDLVPFAERQDNDDVACWDVQSERVVIVHDFGDPRAPDRATFDNFFGWLRQAVEDLIEWHS